MRSVCIVALGLLPLSGLAQELSSTLPAEVRHVEPQPGEQALKCSVEPIKPQVNYALRFQAGYIAHIPLDQYSGPDHGWLITTEITPKGGRTTYFVDSLMLPPVPNTSALGENIGQFTLGEGSYTARLVVADDMGRVCRKQWQIEARKPKGFQNVQLTLEPNAVATFGSFRSERKGGEVKRRITVLLDAAAPRSRRVSARAGLSLTTQNLLLGSLLSLWQNQPDAEFTVHAFSLEQRSEFFSQSPITAQTYEDLQRAIANLNLAQIDAKVLQAPGGHVRLLASMINREVNAANPPDAVIFLGPQDRYNDRMDPEFLDPLPTRSPKFLYLRYQPSPRFPPEELDGEGGRGGRPRPLFRPTPRNFPDPFDTVAFTMDRLKGTTLTFHNPTEFAGALEKLSKLLEAK